MNDKVYKIWDMKEKCHWGKVWKKRGHAQAAIRIQFDEYVNRHIPMTEKVNHLMIEEYEMVKVGELSASELFHGR